MKSSIVILLLAFVSISSFLSCQKENKKVEIVLDQNIIQGLATPIRLNYDTTKLILSDYFMDVNDIIDIEYPHGLSTITKGISDTIIIISGDYFAPLSILKVKTINGTYDIPALKSIKQKYIYTFDDDQQKHKSVALVGDINAWNPANTPLKYIEGKWTADLYLEPDKYAYQIVLDGKWQLDPNSSIKISNGIGGYNSQLAVGKKSTSPKPILFTKETNQDTVYLSAKGELLRFIVLFQNNSIGYSQNENSIRFIIPDIAKTKKRTYIRAWGFNKFGISDEVFIPLEYGKVITKGSELTRQDKETNILYYIMVDRFNNAIKSNDSPLNDPEIDPKADYHGGDLAGINQMIRNDYFKNLGVTSLWLSPIVKNPKGKYGYYNVKGVKSKFSAYHGYWPISFTEVDERFGTSEDLKELVKLAHEKDENVLLDFVANHVHEEHPVYQANKDNNWTTNLYLPDGSLNTEKWDEHRLTTWFDVFLPTLNLEKSEVAEMLSDSAVFWLTKYDIDGFRHDATKHIPLSFWRTLTQKVKKIGVKTGKNYYQVGETYGTPELINSYINSGMLDGQFDFNIYDALIQTIIKDDVGFSLLKQKLNQSIKYYGVHNLMGYMTGNQDKPRFMSLATEEVALDEDSKYAGWSRKVIKKTKKGYDKLSIMHAFILTLPGIPVIYYGDEIGLTGANDPDNRRDMKFKNLNDNETDLLQKVSKLTKLRRNNPVFLFGDLIFNEVSDETMVYSRHYFGSAAIVIINNSDERRSFSIPSNEINSKSQINTIFGGEVINDKVEINPYSFEILMN